VVPHRGNKWAAPCLTSQIGRDAVLSESYCRGYELSAKCLFNLEGLECPGGDPGERERRGEANGTELGR
jgi:hypothetical protein